MLGFSPAPGGDRNPVAGLDRAPPEAVPLTDAESASEGERTAIMAPGAVTDAGGRVLPLRLDARPECPPKGRVAAGQGAGERPAPVPRLA